MFVSPSPTAVTRPWSDTAATEPFADCHAALLVRFSVAPSDNVTVAVNCDVVPCWTNAVVDAVTATPVTLGGAAGVDGVTAAGGLGCVGVLPEQPANANTAHIPIV
jgi:hypothetical protein